jgi:hypothetical protein
VQTANLPQALRTVRDRHPDLRVEVSLATPTSSSPR